MPRQPQPAPEPDLSPKPGLVMNNPKAYPPNGGQRFVLRIEAQSDGDTGMWHNPCDLMQWLCTHPYIKSVKLLELGAEQHNVKKVQPSSKGK